MQPLNTCLKRTGKSSSQKLYHFCSSADFHRDAPNCSLHSSFNLHGFALEQHSAFISVLLVPVPAIIGLKQPLHLGASSVAVQLLHQTLLFSLSMKGSFTKDV